MAQTWDGGTRGYEAGSCRNCLIAQYLSAQLWPSGYGLIVAGTLASLDGKRVDLPKWAQEVIARVDGNYDDDSRRQLSAVECMDIIRGVAA